MSRPRDSWTLTEAAHLLGQPQHRLIYLCEKGVVRPDLADAMGRGSSRGFSSRNLFEFSVAVVLRDLEMPSRLVTRLLEGLRDLAAHLAFSEPTFSLPESLRIPAPADLRIIVADGTLYFTLKEVGRPLRIFRGGEIAESAAFPLDGAPSLGESVEAQFRAQMLGRHSQLELVLTRIAGDLPLGR